VPADVVMVRKTSFRFWGSSPMFSLFANGNIAIRLPVSSRGWAFARTTGH
jgi:hypothetical protein